MRKLYVSLFGMKIGVFLVFIWCFLMKINTKNFRKRKMKFDVGRCRNPLCIKALRVFLMRILKGVKTARIVFFFLQDIVNEDYTEVRFMIGDGDFSKNPLPQSEEEYLLWIDKQLVFLQKRNGRIENFIKKINNMEQNQTSKSRFAPFFYVLRMGLYIC